MYSEDIKLDQQHEDYERNIAVWKKCRDVVEGEEAIHGAGELYLKKLTAEPDDAYDIRVENATFYDATSRTVAGMQGMLFRKKTTVEPENITEHELLFDIDGKGNDLDAFIRTLAFEAEVVNRFGLLTDHTTVEDGITLADAHDSDARPSVLLYKTEAIEDWKYGTQNGKRQLIFVKLLEETDEMDEDGETKKQYRVLDLIDGKYRVRIFDADGGGQIGDDIYPQICGSSFDHIPFDFYPTEKIEKSMILGLVNMNLSHYRTTALHEQCLTRLVPTLCVSGWIPDDGEVMYLGGLTAQTFPSPDAKAYIIEPNGNFDAISKTLTAKEGRMAVLGSRILAEEKKQSEAAETANIHRMGDVSTLSALSIALSKVITTAVNRMLSWGGVNTEVVITINRDFNPAQISPQMLTAMLAAVQAGEMSFETWFNNLKRGEITIEGDTSEAEQERISSRVLPLPGSSVTNE